MADTHDDAFSQPFGVAPPGFRLPDGTHVGVVHLQVSDLPRSLEYYEQVIGLQTLTATSTSATLGVQADARPLLSLHTRPGVTPARRGALGLYHFAILLPDRPALGRFAMHVAERRVRVGMSDHLVSQSLYLTDPDGLGIEVYADRPRTLWRQRGVELIMATEPLDIEDVIAAAGGRPWDGVPSGTTIGHMHLHVGDLAAGEAFYHAALGFDKTVWSYPGALFLAAGGYHHHLGTNIWAPGPPATPNEARLIEWELVAPGGTAADAANSLHRAGYVAEQTGAGYRVEDPWGTRVRLLDAG